MKFSFYVRLRGDMSEQVNIEEACEIGENVLFYIETIFIFLSMLDPQRMKDIDGESLCTAFASLGEMGRAFTSEALSRLEQVETARKKLAEQKGGEQ